jgi:serine/threonine protein kinase
LVPSVVSHFEILEKLGKGGMSVVYKARDTRLGPKFAKPYIGRAYYYATATDFWIAPSVAMPEIKNDVSKALDLNVDPSGTLFVLIPVLMHC